jgi:hypothetical protein
MQQSAEVNHRDMSRLSACTRKAAAVAAALSIILTPGIGWAEVHVESSPGTDTAALAQIVRNQVSAASPRVATLDTRVTIGEAAFRAALNNDDGRPIVAAYLSSTEFAAALGDRPRPPRVTAVFSNPDPLDQLALAKAILGHASIAVFDSPGAHSLAVQLMQRGVTAIHVSPNESIDALLRAAEPFDVIITLPDPIIFNRTNIGHVVRTLYQQHKVLIGYSDTLTRVGSLASVYPTTDGIARTVSQVLEQYAERHTLPSPIFVSDPDISVNDRLARSLNIVLPDVADLVAAVRSKHEAQP